MSPPLNVILFGETGAGKSSVINLIAGQEIAKTSPDVWDCTMSYERHSLTIVGRTFYFWDTVGLEEPEMSVYEGLSPVEQASELIQQLMSSDGVDLLLFCIRGDRVTPMAQSNYQLFYEVLCKSQVPIALVITHLEREPDMNKWWERNSKSIENYGIKAAGHACVTGLPTHHKHSESRRNITRLMEEHVKGKSPAQGLGKPSIAAAIPTASATCDEYPVSQKNIIKLEGHRPKIRHVVFIGETGAGKSSVINLFADRECAATSPDNTLCTRNFVPHDVPMGGTTYRLWDTPGLNDAQNFKKSGGSARIKALKEFLQERYRKEELDLLVFCIRGNRAHKGMLKAYKMFGRTTRSQIGIPVVLVVTHLEKKQPAMEVWWQDNEGSLSDLDMVFDGYACLTCLPGHRRFASQRDIRFLISSEYRKQTPSIVSPMEYLRPKALLGTPTTSLLKNQKQTPSAVSPRERPKTPPKAPATSSLNVIRSQIRHVVFIGETGAGKSSVINLFADRECAATSPDAALCTRDFIPHDVPMGGTTYRLWDTPGLSDEQDFKKFGGSKRISALKEFLQERYRKEELDLLVFCIRGNRAFQGMSKAYRMFGHTTRSQIGIPVVLAATHLEKQQPAMEVWWQDNEGSLNDLGMVFDGCACLTCLPGHRRFASQRDIRFLISSEYRRQTPSIASTREYLQGVDTQCVIC